MKLVLVETPLGYFLLSNRKGEFKIKRSFKFEDPRVAYHQYTLLEAGTPSQELLELIGTDEIIVADEKLSEQLENASVDVSEYRSARTTLLSTFSNDEYFKSLLSVAHQAGAKTCPSEQGDLIVAESINLLDELDLNINLHVMRLREWHSFHFPELSDLISDGKEYVETVLRVGRRVNFIKEIEASADEISEKEKRILDAARMSMGTEISELDIDQIKKDADQILAMYSQREALSSFIFSKLNSICPNLVALVGELVAARLLSKAGSLLHLSRCPAGTIQLMGAEKAFNAAKKAKSDTPKYGFIYNCPIVGQAPPHLKGKMARTVAAKAALACKVDCFGGTRTMGIEAKRNIEKRLRILMESRKKKKTMKTRA